MPRDHLAFTAKEFRRPHRIQAGFGGGGAALKGPAPHEEIPVAVRDSATSEAGLGVRFVGGVLRSKRPWEKGRATSRRRSSADKHGKRAWSRAPRELSFARRFASRKARRGGGPNVWIGVHDVALGLASGSPVCDVLGDGGVEPAPDLKDEGSPAPGAGLGPV